MGSGDTPGSMGKGPQVIEEVIHLGKCQQFAGIRLDWKKEKGGGHSWGQGQALSAGVKSFTLPRTTTRGFQPERANIQFTFLKEWRLASRCSPQACSYTDDRKKRQSKCTQ